MSFFRDVAVRVNGLAIARDEAIVLDDHQVPAPYVDAGSLNLWRRVCAVGLVIFVDNFLLSIRGISIDRKLRWTGFGPIAVGR
jgi:hypothetical protein